MTLTELLPTIRQLSAIEKRELIRILMAEEDISDEQVWKAQFEATTDAQWDSLAEIVRQEIAAGDITYLFGVAPAYLPDLIPSHHLLQVHQDKSDR